MKTVTVHSSPNVGMRLQICSQLYSYSQPYLAAFCLVYACACKHPTCYINTLQYHRQSKQSQIFCLARWQNSCIQRKRVRFWTHTHIMDACKVLIYIINVYAGFIYTGNWLVHVWPSRAEWLVSMRLMCSKICLLHCF